MSGVKSMRKYFGSDDTETICVQQRHLQFNAILIITRGRLDMKQKDEGKRCLIQRDLSSEQS